MTLIPFEDALADASARNAAVGAFTCYDLETAYAVLARAADAAVPVILLVSPASLARSRSRGGHLLPALIGFAAASPAHACVQVDHVDDLALIREALALGAGAVMADGSRLTLAENVAFVREAVRLAASFGAGIEGELGRIEGDEDVAVAAREGRLTDPAQVDEFVRASGAACLAVSIGNAHGRYARPPALDWERLDAIAAATLVPLALHGVSGLPDDVVHTAIRHHVVKVNVNTELREAYLSASEVALPAARVEANLLALHDAQVRAVEKVVDGKLRLCAGSSDSKPRRL